MKGLKEKTIRGGLAKVCAQGATFTLRIGSLMVLGRLLEPNDFGLVGMVTALIGIFNLFRDFGLSTATVQRESITEDQLSTLFWINLLVGTILGVISLAMAPVVAGFYDDSRLIAITAVMAAGFLFNGAGVQHAAILQRQMRFTTSSVIDVVSLVASTAIGIGMALKGFGYWALVVMAVTLPLVTTVGVWLATGWIPGRPRRNVGVRSMMRFGSTITLNCLVVYVANNLEKVLLGRFWGASALGLYGRAYQLINIPTENLNSAVGGVALSALSRLQNEPARLKSYFLKGYSLVLALTIPITIVCALFADDLILVLLGPKWKDAATIFRLLAPTMLVLGLINPLAWLLYSVGLVGRSLKIALVLAPVVISGYLLGLPYGPTGVAFGYSAMLTIWVVPHIAWCVHGTVISLKDIALTVGRPLVSGIVAATLAFVAQLYYGPSLSPLLRLIVGGSILMTTYLAMLLYVMDQKVFYISLVRGLKGPSVDDSAPLVSALKP